MIDVIVSGLGSDVSGWDGVIVNMCFSELIGCVMMFGNFGGLFVVLMMRFVCCEISVFYVLLSILVDSCNCVFILSV